MPSIWAIGRKTVIGGLLLAPFLLLALPADFFNDGPALCPSVILLDRECLGCGMSRASQHLLHLQFSQAWEFNKLSFLVLPILLFYWAKEWWRIIRKFKSSKSEKLDAAP